MKTTHDITLRLGIQQRLSALVAESGLTIAAWGRANGIPRKTVAQWLDGTRIPNAEGLSRLAAVGISPEWLITGIKPAAPTAVTQAMREQVADLVAWMAEALAYRVTEGLGGSDV